MIINVEQTASNLKQRFDISFDGEEYCSGKLGRWSRWQKIELSRREEPILFGRFAFARWSHYIPFRHFFGISSFRRGLRVTRGEEPVGKFVYSKDGLFKSKYVLTLENGIEFYAYPLSGGHEDAVPLQIGWKVRSLGETTRIRRNLSGGRFDYVPIYHEDRQIGMIQTYLTVTNYKYKHKLYLLDEYAEYRELLALFTLYYSNHHYSTRFHMSFGIRYGWSWTYSNYSNKLNLTWLDEHFPNDDFWGKRNQFN